MTVRYSLLTRPNIRDLGCGQKIAEYSITTERLIDVDVFYSAERGRGLVA